MYLYLNEIHYIISLGSPYVYSSIILCLANVFSLGPHQVDGTLFLDIT